MEIKEMGYNFYLIHGMMEDDRTRIITGKSWKLGPHPLLVRSWTPNFAMEEEVSRRVTAIWMTSTYP